MSNRALFGDTHIYEKLSKELPTDPGIARAVIDAYNANSSRNLARDMAKMPAGYEPNAPIIDFGPSADSNTPKNVKPKESDPKTDAPKFGDKNPVSDLPPGTLDNPNPPTLTQPKVETKNPLGDIPPHVFDNPNPPKIGGSLEENKNPIGEKPQSVKD